MFAEIAISRTVADGPDGKGGHRAKFRGKGGDDRGPGGRGEFERGAARVDGFALKQGCRGRRRNREQTVLGVDCAATDIDWRAGDFLGVQQMEAEAGANNIRDGIDRADFVEVDAFERLLMDGGFGFGKLLKNGGGRSFDGSGGIRCVNHFENVGKVAVLRLGLDGDAEFRCADFAAAGFFKRNLCVRIERTEGFCKDGGVGAGVGQSAYEHIAAEAGEGVKIADLRQVSV